MDSKLLGSGQKNLEYQVDFSIPFMIFELFSLKKKTVCLQFKM